MVKLPILEIKNKRKVLTLVSTAPLDKPQIKRQLYKALRIKRGNGWRNPHLWCSLKMTKIKTKSYLRKKRKCHIPQLPLSNKENKRIKVEENLVPTLAQEMEITIGSTTQQYLTQQKKVILTIIITSLTYYWITSPKSMWASPKLWKK